MRVLAAEFVRTLRRPDDQHPPLAAAGVPRPRHPRRALAAGEASTAPPCTSSPRELDGGPVIIQARVPVLPGDDGRPWPHACSTGTPHLPAALGWFAAGPLRLSRRRGCSTAAGSTNPCRSERRMQPRADRPMRALAMLLAMLLALLHDPLAMAQGVGGRGARCCEPGALQGPLPGQLPRHQRRRARDFTASRHSPGPVALRIARLPQPARPRRGESRRPAAQHHGHRAGNRASADARLRRRQRFRRKGRPA